MHINTNEIEHVGYEIANIANEYEVLIAKLFKRISDMPYVTKEWIGNEAQKYVDLVLMSREEFVEFGNELKAFGNEISDSAYKLDSLMNTLQK